MSFTQTVAQIMSLFIIMVIGYIMNKRGIIDDAANERYTKLVINISLPAQIIRTFVSNQGIVSNGEVIAVFAYSALMYVLYAVIGVLFLFFTRVRKDQRGSYMFMMMFANVGFMGFPVIEAILGEEAMIYAVIYNVVFNLLVYSLGILLIGKHEKGAKFPFKKMLNMPLLSAVLSIILYFAKIKLPDPLMTGFGYLGNVTTPVAMLILGSILANMKWKELFDEWRVYVFTIGRLVVAPLAAMVLTNILPIQSELVKGCMILLSAMPVATNTTMLALEYNGDVKLSSKCIFFTTVLCMITIPLITIL